MIVTDIQKGELVIQYEVNDRIALAPGVNTNWLNKEGDIGTVSDIIEEETVYEIIMDKSKHWGPVFLNSNQIEPAEKTKKALPDAINAWKRQQMLKLLRADECLEKTNSL